MFASRNWYGNVLKAALDFGYSGCLESIHRLGIFKAAQRVGKYFLTINGQDQRVFIFQPPGWIGTLQGAFLGGDFDAERVVTVGREIMFHCKTAASPQGQTGNVTILGGQAVRHIGSDIRFWQH